MFEEKLTAAVVLGLLQIRHSEDVCVSECKTGPTQGARNALRMDLWVMPRSWSKPWISAYEIKVTRSDFLSDDKWPGYLPYCNQFSFVCPWGLIDPAEMPDQVGLIYVSKNAERLITKRKPAIRQDVEIPEDLYRYVLMSRAKIRASDMHDPGIEGRRAYELWLKDEKAAGPSVARLIRDAIAKQVSQKVGEVRKHAEEMELENKRLSHRIEKFEELERELEEAGIDVKWGSALETIKSHYGLSDRVWAIEQAHEALGKMLSAVKRGNGSA